MIRRMYLNGKEKLEARRIIQEKTGYIFKSTSILNQIFRRSSFSSETGQNSNEIFEFIGDQVLSYEECQFIYNAVAPLFELCDIEHIAGHLTGKIEFMLEENAGQCAGLYHNPNGGEIKPGFGVVDELRINEFWYAATSSD